jgi:hypothetical protein
MSLILTVLIGVILCFCQYVRTYVVCMYVMCVCVISRVCVIRRQHHILFRQQQKQVASPASLR